MTPSQAAVATCSSFHSFYNDMLANTPHSPAVSAEIKALGSEAVIAGSGDPAKYGSLLDDATNLVGYFGSSAWAHNGNVMSPQVTKMQADCP
jgi:hypothetical protein